MMDSKMTSAALNTVVNLVTLISCIMRCILYSLIVTIQDFYSCSQFVLHLLFLLRLHVWKSSKPLPGVAREGTSSLEPHPTIRISCHDVEVVMKQLGLRHEELFPQDSVDIPNTFDGVEPSLDEVREAFGMFDENKDGFVDAEELKKMMSSLGLVGLSEKECQRMIMVFDDDGDGRICFGEFVKLIEENVFG